MNAETDHDLSRDQWETLKTLRLPAPKRMLTLNVFVIEQLIALDLAVISDNCPVITPKGRKVLIRGSSSLWDVAA